MRPSGVASCRPVFLEEGSEKDLDGTWHASAVSLRQPDLEVIRAANDPAARPVRVIGLVASCPITPPAEMVLVCLEDWTTFFTLRWFFGTPSLADDIDRRLQAGLKWTAVDDLGTDYRGGDYGGGGGNASHWVTTSWFAPRLDPRARRLTLSTSSPTDATPLAITLDVPGA